MIMTDQEDELLIGFEKQLLERIQVLEDALQEILDIANVSDGRAAAFYGMLANRALRGGEIEGYI